MSVPLLGGLLKYTYPVVEYVLVLELQTVGVALILLILQLAQPVTTTLFVTVQP